MARYGSRNEANREKWLEERLRQIPQGSRLLDAGAGEQHFRRYCDHLDYVAQDFAEYAPDGLDSGLQMRKWDYGKLDIISDITSIPEEDASFDAILCSEVFEHVPEPVLAIKEFSRLLRPGGQLILTAPFVSLTHFAPYHYATGFNRYFYETHLKANSFSIDEISCNGSFFELIAQELRRVRSVGRKYSRGRPGFLESLAMRTVLKMLRRLGAKDSGSSELACFGLFVLATRT